MIETISVSSKGQIVIPERIREEMEIQTGSRLVLIEKEGTIIIKKEADVLKHFEEDEQKERIGWMIAGENSLKKVWNNKKDDKVWKKYF